jgi:hypothetical protein
MGLGKAMRRRVFSQVEDDYLSLQIMGGIKEV